MILYHNSQPQEPIDGLNAKKAQDEALARLRAYGFDMERARATGHAAARRFIYCDGGTKY